MTAENQFPGQPPFDSAMVEELTAVNGHIRQVQKIVHEAVTSLSEGFSKMSSEALRQQDALENTLSGVKSGSGEHTLARFIHQGTLQLDGLLRGLESANRRSIALAECLEAALSNLTQLGLLSRDVNNVSEQIRYLALNAAIEAAHAGAAGQGFSIVANEVKDLSVRFRDISERMSEKVDSVQEAITGVTHEARLAAEHDAQLVEHTRGEAAVLGENSRSFDRALIEQLNNAQTIGNSLQQGINLCVMGLQFGDLVAQIGAIATERIDVITPAIESIVQVATAVAPCDPQLARAAETFERQRHAVRTTSVQQTSLEAGDVELF